MPEQTTELIQSIGYAISAVIGVITFLVVTLPNFFKRIKPLRAAVERMLESEPPVPAPVVNGNGSAVVALATVVKLTVENFVLHQRLMREGRK